MTDTSSSRVPTSFPGVLLTTRELARRSGATLRQLEYWNRTGLVVPVHEANGSGTRRGWDAGILPRVRVLVALSRAIWSNSQYGPCRLMGTVAHSLDQEGPWVYEEDGLRITLETTA